jgi:hypothetical protein
VDGFKTILPIVVIVLIMDELDANGADAIKGKSDSPKATVSDYEPDWIRHLSLTRLLVREEISKMSL